MDREQHSDKSIPISIMVFTLNEEANLPLCLESLQRFDDIIIVDSFSSDSTEGICRSAGIRFFQHEFEGFGNQRNWALDNTSPKNDWILILDADERVTPELAEEMARLSSENHSSVGAFRVKRRLHIWGKWLKYSSLYPTWVIRLIHRDRVRYINRGHAETQEVQGQIRELENDLIDENLKGIDEWFERQNRYSTKDAEYELSLEQSPFKLGHMFTADPLEKRAAMKRLGMRMPGRALWYFLYSYIIRKGFLDGKKGLIFCIMKSTYQQMVNIKKFDIKMSDWS